MYCDIASTFGRLPFFSYFCRHYDNTERLLQYHTFNLDHLRTIDFCNDALYSHSLARIYLEHNSRDPDGLFTLFLQGTEPYNGTWR